MSLWSLQSNERTAYNSGAVAQRLCCCLTSWTSTDLIQCQTGGQAAVFGTENYPWKINHCYFMDGRFQVTENYTCRWDQFFEMVEHLEVFGSHWGLLLRSEDVDRNPLFYWPGLQQLSKKMPLVFSRNKRKVHLHVIVFHFLSWRLRCFSHANK